jgi:hypothetical protein
VAPLLRLLETNTLMKPIFASPALTDLYRIVLLTTDAHEVYKHALKELETRERYMEPHDPGVYRTG